MTHSNVPSRLALVLSVLAILLGIVLPAVAALRAVGVFINARSLVAPLLVPVLVNAGLVLLFGIQHSGMARPAWRRFYGRRWQPSTERATYTFFSGAALALLLFAWRPIGGVLWQFEAQWLVIALYTVSLAGWLFALYANTIMGGMELLGARQLRNARRGVPYRPPQFRAPGPYQVVRHPIMLGFLIGMWSAPEMTGDRFVLVAGMSVYLFVGILLEERDLLLEFGQPYREWRVQTPMLLPWRWRAAQRETVAHG